jgi:Protein of unknown function (DUF3313)
MNRLLVAGLLALTCLAGCVIAPGPAERTPDGLVRRQSTRVDSLYAAPGVSLAKYRRVMFDNLDVGFKPDWQARNPQVPVDDITAVRHGAVSMFREEFAQALAKGGYTVANAPAADVLRVNASVVDLDVVSAAAGDTGPGYIVSTADMSLVAELRDSQSGAMLARVADRRQGRNQGNLQLSGQAAQTADARAAFAAWAGYLREALDEARKPPPK